EAGPAVGGPADEVERRAADDVVGIGEEVDRADVARVADGKALRPRRRDRQHLVLHLAEDELPLPGRGVEGEEVVALGVAVDADDRGRVDDVEADDLGAAGDDGAHHLADLGWPQRLGLVVELGAAPGLLVERDDDGGRGVAAVARPEGLEAQPEQRVEREPVEAVEPGRGKKGGRDEGGEAAGEEVAGAHLRRGRGSRLVQIYPYWVACGRGEALPSL